MYEEITTQSNCRNCSDARLFKAQRKKHRFLYVRFVLNATHLRKHMPQAVARRRQ